MMTAWLSLEAWRGVGPRGSIPSRNGNMDRVMSKGGMAGPGRERACRQLGPARVWSSRRGEWPKRGTGAGHAGHYVACSGVRGLRKWVKGENLEDAERRGKDRVGLSKNQMASGGGVRR